MKDTLPRRLLSRKEAAHFLGLSEMTLAIWNSTSRYELPCVKMGGRAKYRPEDLEAFISRRTMNKPKEEDTRERGHR